MTVSTKKKIQKKIPKHPQASSGKFIKKIDRSIESLEEEMIEIDPRKQAFAAAYFDPTSSSYANGLQSAIKVGFTPNYATQLLAKRPKWLLDIVSKFNRLDQAFKNLDEDLKINPKVQAMGAFGPLFDKKTKKPIMVLNQKLIEKRQNATFFVLEKTHPDFRKKDKDDHDKPPVEIKQIFIINPNGEKTPFKEHTISVESEDL